jgi:hypothetical protein
MPASGLGGYGVAALELRHPRMRQEQDAAVGQRRHRAANELPEATRPADEMGAGSVVYSSP